MEKLTPDLLVLTDEEVAVDAKIVEAINLGIRAADEGRVITSAELDKLIPQWISKFSTQNPH